MRKVLLLYRLNPAVLPNDRKGGARPSKIMGFRFVEGAGLRGKPYQPTIMLPLSILQSLPYVQQAGVAATVARQASYYRSVQKHRGESGKEPS
eukprot:3745244-Pleurochrysis_carterae.AAC.2